MSLLDKASLVMIPSGYKEDVVYSVIPESGAGDLSFTRASDGTRINSAGLVENMPYNLFQYSEDFSNGIWDKQNTTITSNSIIAPNGTLTADSLVGNGVNGVHHARQTVNATGSSIHSISVYLKQGTERYAYIVLLGRSGTDDNGDAIYIDLQLGTLPVVAGSGSLATITSVGNGWYKVTMPTSEFPLSTQIEVRFGITTGATQVSTASGFIYIWGAQINLGNTAKQYFATTNRQDVPRLNYQNGGGGCPSLLLEPQRTNLATYSEQFNNAAWTGGSSNATVTANTTISPDGTQNADTVVFGASGYLYQDESISALASATFSIFSKSTTQIIIFGGASPSGTDVYSYQNMGNGWYRQTLTRTFTSGGTGLLQMLINGNNVTHYIWGAQLEAGAYATSYIPTTSASATRVAEACFKTGITSLIGQTQGTIFYDGIFGTNSDELYLFMQKSGSTGINDSIYLQRFSATSQIYMNVYLGGSAQVYSGGGSLSVGDRFKIALAYANNDFVLYINGVQIATDTTGSVPTCANLQVGTYTGAPSNPIYMANKVNQVALFKTRLTNTELAQLTTI